MASELGVGYISILPEVSQVSGRIASALKGVDPVAEQSGRSMGSRISSGMGTALKTSVAGVGIAAGGTLAGAITKGMGRLTGIENAQASLKGLGHDAQSVGSIMDDALASVEGTAFGLEEAASVAASTVAAGVAPGQELERTLTMVGDAATIAGIDMQSMGSIVNKVATSDMMQLDVANQLMDAGIPILQMVGNELGVTANEAREMASAGEVSFATFQNALEQGVGGAALEAGDTFQGALSNMGAALGRLGATGLEPFFDLSKDGMGAATDAIDALEGSIAPMAENLAGWLSGTAVPAVQEFVGSVQGIGDIPEVQTALNATRGAIESLVGAGQALAPVAVDIGSAFAQASAGLGVATWTSLASVLGTTANVLEILAGPLESVTGFLEDHPGLVAAGIAAWGAFKTVPGIINGVTGALNPARDTMQSFGMTIGDIQDYAAASGHEMTRFEAVTVAAGTSSNKTISAMGRTMNNASVEGGRFSKATGAVKAGMEGVRGAGAGLMGLFGGPWGLALVGATAALGAVSNATATAEAAHDAMSESVREGAEAQSELQVAVAGTTGALNEQAVEAAAKVVKAEMSDIIDLGSQYQNAINLITMPDMAWYEQTNFNTQYKEYAEQVNQLADEYAALEDVTEHFGITIDDVNSIVASGGPEYDALIAHLRDTGGASDDLADDLQGARSEITQMVEDARRLDPAVAEASAAIDVLADSSSTADEKLGGLQRMLQAMGMAPKDAEQAMWDAAEATDELVESLEGVQLPAEEVGAALFDMDGNLDRNNGHARGLRDSLMSMSDELNNVAVNANSMSEVDVAWEEMQPAIQALADTYGLTSEQVEQLREQFGLMPEVVKTAVSIEGADEAAKDLALVWAEYRRTPDKKSVEVSAVTEEAEAELEGIGFSVAEIPGSDNIMVTATTDQAKSTLDAVMTQMGDLGDIEVAPSVLLNTDQLDGSSQHAFGILESLNIENPTPQADIIISQLLGGVDISQGQLDYLAGLSPTPTANLNRWLLEDGVNISNGMLNALGNRTDTPTLDANGQPLAAGVDRAKNKINELQDKTVTLTFEERRITYWESRGHSPEQAARIQGPVPVGQTGGRFAGAGFLLPGYADGDRHYGYRLPATGPGTDVVDGFLAMDALGMPAARLDAGEWVINGDSSENYNRELAEINAGTFPKLPGYRDGARIGGEDYAQPVSEDSRGMSEQPTDVIGYADMLGDKFREIPEGVDTTVTLSAEGVAEQLEMITGQLEPMGEGETITIDAVGEQAMAVLTEVGIGAERLPDSEQVEITAVDDEAVDALDGVSGMLDDLGAVEVSPVALMDTTELEVSAGEAQDLVAALDIQEPTPIARIIIDDLLAGKGIAQGELNFLGSMTPTPRADLDSAMLAAGVQFSEGELRRVGNSKATSVVDANNTSALQNIDAVIEGLNRMPVERTIRIVAAGNAASALAGGGRVPGFATGGRLPTTGPGTDTVDGILGVGGDGMPTARVDAGEWVINRRASDEYDGVLAAINAGVFPKVDGYAEGGKVGVVSPDQLLDFAGGAQVAGQQAARSLERAAYVWGGVNWGDCSGAMAGLARFATGASAFSGRFATGNQRDALAGMGFAPGLGPDSTSFNLGWFNGGPFGGHTAGTIAGTNVEMGGGRGDGQIGGAAAGAANSQFTDHAHLTLGELWAFDRFADIARISAQYQPAPSPSYQTEGGFGVGSGGMGVQIAAGLGGGVDSTSTEGVHLGNGQTIPWGARGFEDGGRLPSTGPGTDTRDGILGVNMDGVPTARVDAGEWVINRNSSDKYDGVLAAINAGVFPTLEGLASGGRVGHDLQRAAGTSFPALVSAVEKAADHMGGAAHELERAALGLDTTSDNLEYFLGQGGAHQIMGAVDVSNFGGNWVRQAEIVQEAEAGLADTRATIAEEYQAISDAEDALADAKQALADADQSNAEEVEKATEGVHDAEADLTEARDATLDATARLETAEREIISARFQSVADMATGIGDAAASSMGHLSDYFDEMSRLAGIVESARQEVSQLQMQQVTNQIDLVEAQHDLQVAEWDVQRTRARGAINLVDAEQQVEDARAQAALRGATGIEAMSGAMDRFRETGVFSVGQVSDSVIENSAEVQAALWGVQIVEAQNALDALNAAHAQTMAQYALTGATLTQMQATEMLQLQTQYLTAQTAQMYGLTSNQATGASVGFGGLGGLLGGLGQVIGGALTGVAGFATAGPLGAIPGAIMAITGLGEGIKGGIDLFNNRDDVGDAWSEMGILEQLGIVGGGLLGGAATVGGAYLGGPEGATAGAELGDALIGATIGSFQHSISSQMDKLERDHADRLASLQLGFDQSQADLGADRLLDELEHAQEQDRLEADVAFAELMQQIVQSTNEDMTNALLDAAAVEAARSGHADTAQLGEMRRSGDALDQLVELTRLQLDATRAAAGNAPDSAAQIATALSRVLVGAQGGSGVDANQYVDSRIS